MRWQIVIQWFAIMPFLSEAKEFLYPVAHCCGTFYLIYQKNPHHIELWEWDADTKRAEQLLFSRCTPAGFRLLPSHDGFSFIDNGILKIKKFLKRSARIIELDAPIYQVEVVHWIDDVTCYTSACYQQYHGIFQIDYEGEVVPLRLQSEVDCLYPQKIGNALFYIERDSRRQCHIMQVPYEIPRGNSFKERLTWYFEHYTPACALVTMKQPIIFLRMVSENEGFVIGHTPLIHTADTLITFNYYYLQKNEEVWRTALLFSFTIPLEFLVLGSATRLYESILPLLPQHYGQKIIFSSATAQPLLSLYLYDQVTGVCTALEHTGGLFPPVAGVSGGELDGSLVMGLGEQGVKVELVSVGCNLT